MTAPALAPSTPIDTAPQTQSSVFEDVIATTLQSLPSSDESNAATEAERVRDEKGRFVAQQTESTDPPTPGTEPVPVDGTTPTDADAPPVVEVPEGYTLPATLPPERASFFTVKDAEGEIAAPDLTWEITANGKPRTLSTDKLVQYAQMGVYNHEREQAFEQAQSQAQELSTQYQSLEAQYQALKQDTLRLLADPDYLVQSIQEYERYNTPEAQAERARQELEQTRQQQALLQLEQHAEQFVSTELEPALETIAGTLPTVGREELAARLYVASQRYRGPDGVLRPDGFQPLQQYILTDLVPWAKQLHEARQSEREAPKVEADKAKAQAEANATAARIRAQKAKRQAALATQPVGRRTATEPPPTNTSPIRTQRDLDNSIVASVLASVGGGG